MTITILQGDVVEKLKELPDKSVHCVVTSPPYYGLRNYGVDGQIGLEKTPEEYVQKLVEVFREVGRVMRDDGTLWLNLGDSYSGSNSTKDAAINPNSIPFKSGQTKGGTLKPIGIIEGLKPKDMIGIPWRIAFALQADGWYLRSDIIWNKPNPMPESVTDRPTKSHEYIFLLTKNARYFYDADAIREPASDSYINDSRPVGVLRQCVNARSKYPNEGQFKHKNLLPDGQPPQTMHLNRVLPKQDLTGNPTYTGFNERWAQARYEARISDNGMGGQNYGHCGNPDPLTRNARTVWTITTQARPEAHFACVDDITEALTVNGWKNIHQLGDTDTIVGFDGEQLMWTKATIHRFPFSGKMVAASSRDLSMWLTPNHRVVCRDYKRKGEWKIKRADQLLGREEIPTSAQLFFNSSNVHCPDEALAELAGWVLTDGSYNRGNTISLYQTGGRGKHEQIESLFSKLGVNPTLYRRDRGHGDERSYSFAGPVAEFIKKEFPYKEGVFSALFTWSERDLKALWRGMTEGDGNKRKDGRITFVGNRSKVDFYQALSIRLGKTCRVSYREGNSFAAFVSKKNTTSMRGTNGQAGAIQDSCFYDGIVWCPHVVSGMWLARRNGRPFITGNTFPDEIPRRCISAGCPVGGVVLDPFGGSGTTGDIARELKRDCILIELNPEYIKIMKNRLRLNEQLGV